MDEWKLTNYYLVQGGHDGDVTGYLYSETPQQRANAAFIVRACNAHEELLTALRRLVDNAGITWLPGYKEELDEAMRDAHAAICKAEVGIHHTITRRMNSGWRRED